MNDLLTKVVEVLAAHPAAAAALGAVVLLALLSWGVISSSYRYR